MRKYGTCIIACIDSLLQYYIKCAEGLHFSAFSFSAVLISRQTLNFSVALPQCPYLVRTGIISVKLSGVVVQLMQDMLHPALICACIYMYV